MWTIRTDGILDLWDQLGNWQTVVAGMRSVKQGKTQANKKPIQQARNDDLERDLDYFDEFRDPALGHPMFGFLLPGDIHSQQRAGFKSNTINPQTSKVHRFLIAMKDWTVSVPVTGKGDFKL